MSNKTECVSFTDFIDHRRYPKGSKTKRLIILDSIDTEQIIIAVSSQNDVRIKQINRQEGSTYVPVFQADCSNPFVVRKHLYDKLKQYKCTGNREHKYDILKKKNLFDVLCEEMPNIHKVFLSDRMGFWDYYKEQSKTI